MSGGGPYSILLPTRAPDPVLEGEPRRLPFTDALRVAFRWAGFPGREPHADRDDVRRFVAGFGKGLAPF